MVDTSIFILTMVTALGCGLIAGTFFVFSTTIMRALGRLAPHAGIAAMQSINVVIVSALFLAVFLATAVACAAIMVAALLRWSEPGAGWALAGGGLYVIGSFGVTLGWNVPLNNELAGWAASDPRAAPTWARYLRTWIRWNHVRTGASLAAMAAFLIALIHRQS
jgi:uncharacterized membrane protein